MTSNANYQKVREAQAEYKKHAAFFAGHRRFIEGGNPGKLLSSILRNQDPSVGIVSIKTSQGRVKSNKNEIKGTFVEIFANLYKSENNIDVNRISTYLSDIETPKISEAQNEIIEKEIELSDLKEALNSFSGNTRGGWIAF